MTDEQMMLRLTERLMAWYPLVRRELPWRDQPSPYHVWISEIMLQQTRIEAVKGYYRRFLDAFPEITDLANADEQQVMKQWEGLGYYSRARNLKKAAEICRDCYGGELPADVKLLRELPGIGAYTAGAVGSIAFHLPVPAVDGNVMRVLSRYLADGSDIAKEAVRRSMEQRLMPVLPGQETGDFNQAIMELGETVCIPNGRPLCELCPLREECRACTQGTMEEFPVKNVKKGRKIQQMTVLLVRVKDSFAIRRRPKSGLLAGMYELPWLEGHLEESDLQSWMSEHCIIGAVKPLPKASHIFSHIEWHMIGWALTLEELPSLEGWEFHTVEEIRESFPIPTAMKKYDQYLHL